MSETIRFLRGAVRKPQAAQAFEDLVLQAPFITGEVIYGFPLNGVPGRGIFAVDAVLISPRDRSPSSTWWRPPIPATTRTGRTRLSPPSNGSSGPRPPS